MTKVRLTMKSRNKKTGPIPVSTTEEHSCPDICPLKQGGCYAKGGPLAIVWKQTETIGDSWKVFCGKIKNLKDGQLWRMNQAGDLPHKNGTIDKAKVELLVNSNIGKKGFTYTHHDMTIRENILIVAAANVCNFTVNLSANNLDHADALTLLSIAPVVTILPIDQVTNTTTPAGNKVTVCPAAIDTTDNITCKTCKLCADPKRKTIIGFPAHGAARRKASTIAETA